MTRLWMPRSRSLMGVLIMMVKDVQSETEMLGETETL